MKRQRFLLLKLHLLFGLVRELEDGEEEEGMVYLSCRLSSYMVRVKGDLHKILTIFNFLKTISLGV